MKIRSFIFLSIFVLALRFNFSEEVFTFDKLFPTTDYEKIYNKAANLYYFMQDYEQSEKSDKIKLLFLENQWTSLLNLYCSIKQLNESGQMSCHMEDYLCLYDLITQIEKMMVDTALEGDLFVSSKTLLSTVIKIMDLEIRKASQAKAC